jgi:hypothetical protein
MALHVTGEHHNFLLLPSLKMSMSVLTPSSIRGVVACNMNDPSENLLQ